MPSPTLRLGHAWSLWDDASTRRPAHPTSRLYFFPKKGEMFLYFGNNGAVRVPVAATDEEPRKLAFTFRWSEKDEPPSTHVGSVSATGNKWVFDFDTLKDSTCHPTEAANFYKITAPTSELQQESGRTQGSILGLSLPQTPRHGCCIQGG